MIQLLYCEDVCIQNTKFFHKYLSFRQNKKFIWEIQDESVVTHSGQEAIKTKETKFYKSFFNDSGKTSIINQLNSVRLFPNFVRDEDQRLLEQVVTKEEILGFIRGFSKDKSLGPDGWTIDFFLFLFELIGRDLLDVVEESRVQGKVINLINSTFIALIPKCNKPTGLSDFRLIALCNLSYKIIAKVISKRIRPILSRSLSLEKLGFLKGRQILDAIRTAQECLHSIKSKKLQSTILKLDLKKAYDCTNWDYLRLILLQSGFGTPTTNCIMACVSSTNYAILINGEPTNFFNSNRGLRQGCLISPLLFILMMEGLNLALNKAKDECLIYRIKVSRMINILHLLFVDNILIMSRATLIDWTVIQDIL
jgi:hypothetical protein